MIMIPDTVRGLIFDCDGTLADNMPAHFRAWTIVTQRHGLTFTEDRFYQLGGTPSATIAAILAREQGKVVDAHLIAEEKEREFLEQLAAVRPIPPIVETARAQRGVRPMAVASGGYRSVVLATLEQIGVLDWFPVVVTAEDVMRPKPAPDVFLEAAKRLDVQPESCLVFEDTGIGIAAARDAGMQVFDVRDVYTPPRVT